MVGRRRIRDHGKPPVGPVERPGLDHDAADARAVAADELGRRVDHDVGAPFDRAAQVRRRERVVHDQRQLAGMRDGRHGLDVQHVPARVADRLGEERLGVRADRFPPCLPIVGIDPGQLDVHLAQHVLELVHRAAVERRGRDHVVARLQQREQRGVLRGEPARERHRAGAALEVRHPLLEHRGGRVHDARVGVPVLLQVEVRRRRFRVLEHVAGGLEDRHRAGARVRVGPLPGVQLPGLESERAGFFWLAGHEGSSRNWRMMGVCRASSSRKQSWPYGASITWSSTGLPRAAKRAGDVLRRGRRVQPVGTERDQQRPRLHAFQCLSERSVAVLPREIEIGQRARHVEVGVGVEAPDERVGLMPQVALDLELRLGDRVADVVGELQPPAELVAQRQGGQVRYVADHPRHAHAGVGRPAGAVVAAALPGRIAHDRLRARSRSRPRPAAAGRACWRWPRRHRPGRGTGSPTRRPASRRGSLRSPPRAARYRVRQGTLVRSVPCPPP